MENLVFLGIIGGLLLVAFLAVYFLGRKTGAFEVEEAEAHDNITFMAGQAEIDAQPLPDRRTIFQRLRGKAD